MNTPPIWTTVPACLRCQTLMVKGFQMDHALQASLQIGWTEGEPRSPKFLGMPVGGPHLSGDKDAARFPITVFRCPACGLLEYYALPEQPSQK